MNPQATQVLRPAYHRTVGIVYFGRMVDKIRLRAAGTLRSDFLQNMTEFFVTLRRAHLSSALTGIFRLPLLLLTLLGSVLPHVHAVIPAAATNDALYAKGYLVVTHYPGVVVNGGVTNAATTTAGLNAAGPPPSRSDP